MGCSASSPYGGPRGESGGEEDGDRRLRGSSLKRGVEVAYVLGDDIKFMYRPCMLVFNLPSEVIDTEVKIEVMMSLERTTSQKKTWNFNIC